MARVGEGTSRATPAPGATVAGRYELVALVGTGGMAQVWEAVDHVLGRRVAVKILHAHLAADHDVVQRFRREAIASARLSHPNIVAVYDTVAASDAEPFDAIVMELVSGRTLRELLDADGPLDEAGARALALDLLGALECAHSHGLVHRDIKPANVLVAGDGTMRLTDFGIAKSEADADLTVVGTLVGTAAYLAPEQVGGGTVDARSDLYAVATVIYEAASGRVPFRGESAAATALARLHRDPDPLEADRDRPLSPGFRAAVMRGLERDPSRRHPSAAEMSAAFAGGAAAPRAAADRARDDTAPQPVVSPRAARPVRRRRARRPTAGRLLLSVLLIGPVALIAVLVADGISNGNGSAPTTVPPPAGPISVVDAVAFDPLGDGTESDDAAARVLDGDPATSWTTEQYNSQTFGTKPGVGLVLQLAEPHRLTRLRIQGSAGWSGVVHAARRRLSEADGPPTTGGTPVRNATADQTVDLDDVEGSSILIWITDLGPSEGRHRVTIAEVQVTGRPIGAG